MAGITPSLRLTLKSYFRPLNFAIIWEVMGIGIPASIESVLFNGGKLLTQMFVAGMGTDVIAGNFIASPLPHSLTCRETRWGRRRRSSPADVSERGR